MPRLEEKSGHAFCASANHAGNVTDGVPVADEGFSSCTTCARSATSWNIWPGLRFAARPAGRSRQRFRYFPPGSWAPAQLGHGRPSDPPEPGNELLASRTRWCIAGSWLARLADLE